MEENKQNPAIFTCLIFNGHWAYSVDVTVSLKAIIDRPCRLSNPYFTGAAKQKKRKYAWIAVA